MQLKIFIHSERDSVNEFDSATQRKKGSNFNEAA